MLSPLEEICHEDYSLVSRIYKSNSLGVFYYIILCLVTYTSIRLRLGCKLTYMRNDGRIEAMELHKH
jgi:hypothetical protein